MTDLVPVLCLYSASTKTGEEYPGGKMIHVRRSSEIERAFEAAMLADQRSSLAAVVSFATWKLEAYVPKSGKAKF